MAHVEVKWLEGMRCWAIPDSGHAVVMDTEVSKGGKDSAARPMELLLISLAGCTGMDVIYILRKMRVKVDGFELVVDAERAPQHPKVYAKVHVKYIFYGKNIPENKVKEAIELSQHKYCGASATVRAAGELTYDFEIRESE